MHPQRNIAVIKAASTTESGKIHSRFNITPLQNRETVAQALSEVVECTMVLCKSNKTPLQKRETVAEVLSDMLDSTVLL